MATSEYTTATKLNAFRKKQTPTPAATMRMPATAGPTARAALTMVELRLTALRTFSPPTISRTNDCRAGFSKVLFSPSAKRQDAHLPEGHDVSDGKDAEHQGLDTHEALQHDH